MDKVDNVVQRRNNNVLLAKDDVGKPKPSSFQLPPKDFVYGKSQGKDNAGVAVVTSSWNYHSQSKGKDIKVDFQKINKVALQRGINSRVRFIYSDVYYMVQESLKQQEEFKLKRNGGL